MTNCLFDKVKLPNQCNCIHFCTINRGVFEILKFLEEFLLLSLSKLRFSMILPDKVRFPLFVLLFQCSKMDINTALFCYMSFLVVYASKVQKMRNPSPKNFCKRRWSLNFLHFFDLECQPSSTLFFSSLIQLTPKLNAKKYSIAFKTSKIC